MQKTILSTALLLGCLSLHAQRVLTLEQCRDAAINHNIAVRSANRSLEKVQKQKKEAFTKYFPICVRGRLHLPFLQGRGSWRHQYF